MADRTATQIDEGEDVPTGPPDSLGGAFDRRGFIKGVAGTGLGLAGLGGASSLLAACGSSSSTATSARFLTNGGPVPATPVHGGNLRIGFAGNGTSETYSPALANTIIDNLHTQSVFDSLIRVGPYHTLEPGLALGWEHNSDATVWEIRLRDGVYFSDGKPFGADDVIYNLHLMGSPAHLGHPAVVNVRLNDVRKLSNTLVQVPLDRPVAQLQNNFIFVNAGCMIQNGEKNPSTKPVGTGAFKLESFTPGVRSVLTRNDNYWDAPRPYPDQFEIISISDDTARLNALEAGEIDIAGVLNYAQAARGSTSQYDVLVGYGGTGTGFVMRTDQAPFNDARVRLAMKLVIDRPAMCDIAFNGLAEVLNDIPGKGFQYYNTSLPQHAQDIEQAKSLLKAAGRSGMSVLLQTAPGSGEQLTQMATVFAQQAAAAGVKVSIKTDPIASYFNPAALWLKMTFAQTYWPVPSVAFWFANALIQGADENETHWSDPETNRLYSQALGATNSSAAQSLWWKLQEIQWAKGGYIFPTWNHNVDALAKNVAGVGGPGTGWLYPTGDLHLWNWGFTHV